MATVFLNQDETVDSYKIYSSQKTHGCKGNRRFDMHGFDHTGQQNDSHFGTWLMPCPDFLSSVCRRWRTPCSCRFRTHSVLNPLKNKIGQEETGKQNKVITRYVLQRLFLLWYNARRLEMYPALYSFVRNLCSVLNDFERKDELVPWPQFDNQRMSNLDIQILAQLAQSLIKKICAQF